MDVQYPYADGLSRRQLLYRLASTPEPRRLLIVGVDNEDALIGAGWGGSVTFVAVSQLEVALTQGTSRFDAVALPWVLGPPHSMAAAHGPHPDSQKILAWARLLLVPGGVVIGHMEHGCALRRLLHRQGLYEFGISLLRPNVIASAPRCLEALDRAGYTAAECFYVQPSIDAPMALIPSQGPAARGHFLRATRSARGQYGPVGYTLRLLLAAAGLAGLLQPQLFFWARRAC